VHFQVIEGAAQREQMLAKALFKFPAFMTEASSVESFYTLFCKISCDAIIL